ncbi:MAG: hypothetical protein ACT6TH_09840 [Brevundimonas sp.]|uniref:hypothetical protein n=1 Tax=Brevundimonas sp. TaxID=1871086 RepID=UPI0040349C7A
MIDVVVLTTLLTASVPERQELASELAELRSLEACVLGSGVQTTCTGLEDETRGAIACLDRPLEAEVLQAKMCFMGPVLECMEAAAPATIEAASLVERLCGLRWLGGLKLAIHDWLDRAEDRASPQTVARMRALLPDVERQAAAQAEAALADGGNAAEAIGYRFGAWTTYAYQQRARLARERR